MIPDGSEGLQARAEGRFTAERRRGNGEAIMIVGMSIFGYRPGSGRRRP